MVLLDRTSAVAMARSTTFSVRFLQPVNLELVVSTPLTLIIEFSIFFTLPIHRLAGARLRSEWIHC